MSPSVAQTDGATIALGIVPDKLDSQYNYDLGWAHTYSLPREWSLSDNGQLIQRPYYGLQAMRDPESGVTIDAMVDGIEKIADMDDRKIEVVGEFAVGNSDFGLIFYSSNGDGAKLYYSPSSSKLTLDMSKLPRWRNDEKSFDGLYTTSLPTQIAAGTVMKIHVLKIHVFVDHSVMDIFINDMWASSVRLFPTDEASSGVEVFTEGGATQAKIEAWALNLSSTGINDITSDIASATDRVNVYNMMGALVRSNVYRSSALNDMPSGLYIVDGKKYLVR